MSPPTLPHRQCAAVILQSAAGQVLLVQHAYGGQRWSAPGGVVEVGETPMGAATREAAEETGLEVEITGLIGLYLLRSGGWPDILSHVFTARIASGTPQIMDATEIARIGWRSLDDLPTPLVPDVETALEDLRAGCSGVVRTVRRRGTLPPLE